MNKAIFSLLSLCIFLGARADESVAQCDYFVEISAAYGSECVYEILETITDANTPTYQWYKDSVALAGETDLALHVLALGDYYVEITDQMGCVEASSIYSITNPPAEVTITGDTSFCEWSTAELIAITSGEVTVEYWVDGNDNTFSPGEDTVWIGTGGMYQVLVFDGLTVCFGYDTVYVSETMNQLAQPTIYQSNDTLFTDSAVYYQWYRDFEPIAGETMQYLVTSTEGIYQVEIGDTLGCQQLSNPFIIGENLFTYPPDIVFQYCNDVFNPDFTGQPVHQDSVGILYFRDSYIRNGMVVHQDSTFKKAGYAIGDYMPDLVALDQNETLVHTSMDPTKPTIIDFCTMWCTPCQNYPSTLEFLFDDLNNQNTPVNYFMPLFQNLNGITTTLSDAQTWADYHNIEFPVLWGNEAEDMYAEFGFNVVPVFVVLGIDQEIYAIQEGVDNIALSGLVQDYYNEHIMCSDTFDLIEREWQWEYNGHQITLPEIQVINFIPDCDDGFLNGNESHIDCGGPDCPPCTDGDGDGIVDTEDNCPDLANPVQSDQNGNGIGDLCDSLTLNVPKVGVGTGDPRDGLQLEQGNVYVQTSGAGIVLTSPDGNCWKVIVSDTGDLISQQIDCPNFE